MIVSGFCGVFFCLFVYFLFNLSKSIVTLEKSPYIEHTSLVPTKKLSFHLTLFYMVIKLWRHHHVINKKTLASISRHARIKYDSHCKATLTALQFKNKTTNTTQRWYNYAQLLKAQKFICVNMNTQFYYNCSAYTALSRITINSAFYCT